MTTTAPEPAVERLETLSTTADGRVVPSAWQRAVGIATSESRFVSWFASLFITAIAFILRIWNLGTPHSFEFDETYYAKDAWSLIHFGWVENYVGNANDAILDGHTAHLWNGTPEMIVHPEIGKWLIGIGEAIFGMTPFGWRFASVVVGSLLILLLIRFVRRITGSTLLGCVAGILMTFDGLEFVLSRLALLDIFLAFFVLAAVHCLVADRQWYRAKLAALVPEPITDGSWGPIRGLRFRPWLLASGICWGLACGTKWDAAYPLAAFGILCVAWSAGARRSFGVRWSFPKSAVTDGLVAFLHLVVVAVLVYVASWTGWLIHHREYENSLSSTQYTHFTGSGHCEGSGTSKTFVADNPDNLKKWPTATEGEKHGVAGVVQAFESLWYYHRDVYTFHTNFLNCSSHPYGSQPAGWLLLNRPVGVAADNGVKPGALDGGQRCTAASDSTCLRQVLLLGTPVLWWVGAGALVAALVFWIGTRDWRFGVAVVGAAATWLPWLQYASRPIFSYYAMSTLPFTVLALALCIGKLVGRSRVTTMRRTVGVGIAGAFVCLVLVNFAWFWPVYTYQLLTHSAWLDRIWFSRWI